MPSANHSDPWNVVEGSFPRTSHASEQLRFLLQYAVLAPSTRNVQPWKFRLVDTEVELSVDTTRALPVVDPQCRELVISCGAALLYLRVALRHFHFAGTLRYFPDPEDPNLLARLGLGDPATPTADEEAMFKALPRRHTCRLPFRSDTVFQPVLDALAQAAEANGAWLRTIDGREARAAVAHVIAEADVVQQNDARYRRELAAWLRPNRAQESDGLPGYVFGWGDFKAWFAPFAARWLDSGKRRAAHDRELAEAAPLLALLGTPTDTPADWLNAGQALAQVLLLARSQGLQASYFNAPLEVPELRQRLLSILHRSGAPQLLLRLGRVTEGRPTPRRPVGEVLTD